MIFSWEPQMPARKGKIINKVERSFVKPLSWNATISNQESKTKHQISRLLILSTEKVKNASIAILIRADYLRGQCPTMTFFFVSKISEVTFLI